MVIWSRADQGLLGHYSLAWLAGRHRRLGSRRPLPLDGTEHGRGEKREGGREGPEFKLNFCKISNRNLKNSKHESCREFENLQLLF
jgi:hypothetical protein